MEKKGNICPVDMCEKIYKKVTASPAFRTIRRISHPLQPPSYATPTSDSAAPVKIVAIQFEPKNPKSTGKEAAAGVMVPVNFDYSKQPQEMKIGNASFKKNATQAEHKQESFKVNPEEGDNSEDHIENRFTAYINRTKSKIRRTLSIPGERNNAPSGSGKYKPTDNGAARKDKFTDYIEHTKKKLRTTSSIGADNRNSIK